VTLDTQNTKRERGFVAVVWERERAQNKALEQEQDVAEGQQDFTVVCFPFVRERQEYATTPPK
jgi:hypothetical protein